MNKQRRKEIERIREELMDLREQVEDVMNQESRKHLITCLRICSKEIKGSKCKNTLTKFKLLQIVLAKAKMLLKIVCERITKIKT